MSSKKQDGVHGGNPGGRRRAQTNLNARDAVAGADGAHEKAEAATRERADEIASLKTLNGKRGCGPLMKR